MITVPVKFGQNEAMAAWFKEKEAQGFIGHFRAVDNNENPEYFNFYFTNTELATEFKLSFAT